MSLLTKPGLSRLSLLLIALPLLSWGQLEDQALLPEDEAFAFHAQRLPDHRLAVQWDIADGYYMYRDKMDFDLVGGHGFAGTVELPPGQPKEDEFFGAVEVYTGSFRMVLPLAETTAQFTLIAEGQGCNEPVGVCYPPLRHEIIFGADFGTTFSSTVRGEGGLVSQSGDQSLPIHELAGSGQTDPVAELKSLLQPTRQEADPDRSDLSPNDRSESIDEGRSNQTESQDPIEALKALLDGGFSQPDFLPPEEAFRLTAEMIDGNTLNAHFEVVDGYYLYRDKIAFATQGDARVGHYVLPDGKEKEDEFFGRSQVFTDSFSVPIDLLRPAPQAGSIVLNAQYQGCAEAGICYPPSTQSITLALPPLISTSAAAQSLPPPSDRQNSLNPSSNLDADPGPDTRSLWGILTGALLAGLLLTFTPCVLPMIPILSGAIAGQGEKLTRARGGALAVTYVIGTSVTYAAMGALAGATGEQLQAYFQNIWAIGILATVFFLMALSMFGLYEIQMPSAIQSRLQSRTMSLGGSYSMVFILGLVSALIVGACVSPILISFLGLAVSRADPWLGAQMMLAMAMGMGVPLIALGFGAGHLLPKAGAWMERIKHIFGILLIAVAIYLLGVLPEVPVLLLWGVFLVIISIYLGATQSLQEGASGWQRLAKGVGTVLLVWGIAALIGGFHGKRDLLQPLPTQWAANNWQGTQSGDKAHVFTQIRNTTELDQQFIRARQDNRHIVLDYYADWCVDCLKMEKTTFQDPRVVQVLEERYIALQVDVTDPTDSDARAVKKRFGVFGPPAVLFFDPQGHRLPDLGFYGYRDPTEFLALINP